MASSSNSGGWELSPFDPGSTQVIEKDQQKKITNFVSEYGKQLREIEEALDESLSDVWDISVDPIELDFKPYEQTGILDIIKTDNKLFNKLIIVFSSLSLELVKLEKYASSKYLIGFVMFGEEIQDDEPTEGEAQLKIGRMMGFLTEFSKFIDRCYTVVRNVIRQLASLYHSEQQIYKQSFRGVHLEEMWKRLGEFLSSLIVLDEVITQNDMFNRSWAMYKRMAKAIRIDPGRYGVNESKMLQFDKLLLSLEGKLFDGLIFQNCVEQEFDFPGIVSVRKNAVFRQEFLYYLRFALSRIISKSPSLSENRHVQSKHHQYIEICALYSFYFAIFKTTSEKKLFRAIWELYKEYPLVHLIGDFVWSSTDFLSKKVPLTQTLSSKQNPSQFRRQFLAQMQQQFQTQVRELFMKSSVWMVRIESNLVNRADISTVIETRIKLLLEGIKLANQLSDQYKVYVNLHLKLRRPINPREVPLLIKSIELLKAIQSTFHRRSGIIGETIAFMLVQITSSLQNRLLPIKNRLQRDKKFSVSRLDSLAGLSLALQALNCCSSKERRTILRLCIHLVYPISQWKDNEQEEIRFQIDRLSILCELQDFVSKATDCSFLFWNQSLLEVYFKSIRRNPSHAYRLPYIFSSFRDIDRFFKQCVHHPYDEFVKLYKQEILSIFETEIVKPLQTTIENDLRFHIHCHLKVEQRDPFRKGVIDYRPFLELPALRFFDRNIHIKQEVTHYLDETFYNLNTVQLSDWKTYGEMRNLAHEKYNLQLTEVHLPGQTLEQGLDVLEIMKQIHLFVGRYAYNLNNQIFIQRESDSKFLNTINIQHIANSIRTHGTGIMNTAVNFTYQFLRRKFSIFSQFLFDDYIKSHLYRDVRFFKDNRNKINNEYPFQKAEAFNKEIRKLGINNKGLSYMDQFRGLVTEIGNAMGYIRMIRSAGMLYTGNAIKFVPDLRDIPSFADQVEQAGLSQHTLRAAENLDKVLQTLAKNFAEGTDYFKMLVAVFIRQFRDSKNLHLNNFYMIVPPLMINFIEHSIQMKEKLAKKKTIFWWIKSWIKFY